jgi:PAS domain S-box-containing protein
MNRALRILILEDVPTDADLMEYELSEAGIAFTSKRVAVKAAYIRALEEFSPEMILSDYSLPSFDGLSALTIARERCPEAPFIFVSGALGEEKAIELLKQGATDYVLKDRLSRLGPAVTRALHEVEERNERIRAEEALKESEVRYRTIFENTGTATVIVDEETIIVLANKEFERLSGGSRSEIEGKRSWMSFVVEEDRSKLSSCRRPWEKKFKMPPQGYEFRIAGRRGEILHVLANLTVIPPTQSAVISFLNITERKSAEEALKKREQDLELKSRSLGDANTALKVLLKHREEDKAGMEENVLANVRKLVLPYVENLKYLRLNDSQMAQLKMIETHLTDIISPFLHNLTSEYLGLTPREIQVANLVKEGKTTKEISLLLNISDKCIDFHRKNLRSKLGIKNLKSNLRSHLLSLSS